MDNLAEACNTPLISFDNVSRSYHHGRVQALREVSLSIGKREYVAITGPSGSGKSTLLYLASGLDRPDSGRVYFEGRQPAGISDWTRLRATRMGFVFQSFHLVAGLTAAENVELPMFGVIRTERARRLRVAELLTRVGLDHRTTHRVAELSGGESQRVALARALANSPRVILADEPTGNLDSRTASEVLELLEDLHRRDAVALLVVTHDPRVSERAPKVVRLLDGRVTEEQQPAETQ